jgi:hypothetical protein
MTYDPMEQVVDTLLTISDESIAQLVSLRNAEHFPLLPGVDTREEKARLSKVLDALLDRLIKDVGANPSKRWVLQQFRPALEAVQMEDTEAKEHFGAHLEQIMDVLNIESSDGLLGHYL